MNVVLARSDVIKDCRHSDPKAATNHKPQKTTTTEDFCSLVVRITPRRNQITGI